MTAQPDEGAPSITRSSLLAAAGDVLHDAKHEYVPDENDLSCARCENLPENWRHSALRVAVVVRNPRGPAGAIPKEWASVQFDIPVPRPGSQ